MEILRIYFLDIFYLHSMVSMSQVSFSACEVGVFGVSSLPATKALISRISPWCHAMGFFRSLAAATVLPDEVSCGAAMAGCEKSRQWTQALSIFDASKAGM